VKKKIFLLSPANASGKRAGYLTSGKSSLSTEFRSTEGCALSEAYAFMSSLYFRGKLAYSQKYGDQSFIITPGFGLVSLDWKLTASRFSQIRETQVSAKSPVYVDPFRRDAEKIAALDSQIILLGSIATGKYLDVLKPIFGSNLFYPEKFKSLGDMSRGAMMLNSCREGVELDYVSVDYIF
jgi:hypothetical protein